MLPSELRPLQSFRSSRSFKDLVMGSGSPKMSAVQTNALGFKRFESLAEEWTLLRLDDAHALSNMSRRLHDTSYFNLHKNWGLVFQALPVFLPWALARASFPGRGAIQNPA
jgi:hypothetical protein